MAGQQSARQILPQVIGVTAFSAVGAVAAWYLARRLALPIQMDELEMSASAASASILPPDLLAGSAPSQLQLLQQGHGPLYVRSYQVDIDQPQVTPQELIGKLTRDLNAFVPIELAQFEKITGKPDALAEGDEFFIHIAGPWDGPVRVIAVNETSFTFATLPKHLEAGEIRFSAEPHPDRQDALRFRIQSWARSSSPITDLFYRILGLSKFMQTTMWGQFCSKVVEASGGTLIGKINVMTHRVRAQQVAQQIPLWKQYAPHFDHWRKAALNFDINKVEEYTVANGWRIDDYSIGLPGELAGEPVPNGAFEIAKQVIMNYEFPDPALITGIFPPDDPLADRLMILRARFLIFTFLFGVRISRVIDEVRETEKRGNARVWGFGYQTLEGHFEMGEITFELWKFMDSGEIEFRIHAYSKTGTIRNPFYRIGFRLFGRSLQVRFAQTALQRMQQIVVARLAESATAQPVETPEVVPLEADQAASEKAEDIAEEATAPIKD